MKKLVLIILLAITGLSAGSSNHANKPTPSESDKVGTSIDDQTAKVDKLLVKLKSKR